MARKQSPILTEGELEIMEVLWDRREASVRDVTEALSGRRPVAYNTVLTMLRILKDKSYAAYRKEGRAFIYYPLITRREARSRALRNLIGSFFDGSAVALAQNLVDDTEIDLAELERLQSKIDDEKGERP
ncbi:MAG: BlaI/MecI/CopY family transcriptional regulator [Gammaproteobacteria bacterium]